MEGASRMKIRMAKVYGAYTKGEIVELPERQAESLIAWEYATRVDDSQQSLIETAAVEPVVETADVTPRRRKK
jgi:hypothetical protein